MSLSETYWTAHHNRYLDQENCTFKGFISHLPAVKLPPWSWRRTKTPSLSPKSLWVCEKKGWSDKSCLGPKILYFISFQLFLGNCNFQLTVGVMYILILTLKAEDLKNKNKPIKSTIYICQLAIHVGVHPEEMRSEWLNVIVFLGGVCGDSVWGHPLHHDRNSKSKPACHPDLSWCWTQP